MEIKILEKPISREELGRIAGDGFGDMVKAVVDVEQGILAIDAEFHADIESFLMENKQSKREHAWGINLYPEKTGDDFIVFDSMVNLKPAQGNRTRNIESDEVKERIKEIVSKCVYE